MKRFLCLILTIVTLCVCAISANAVFFLEIFHTNAVSLMYHKISEDESQWGDFCISPQEFERDIKYLKENGYRFYTASQLKTLPMGDDGKNVFITFDDGYESDYLYALPILEKYDAKATFFVIGATIDTEDHISKEHLFQLAQSECVEIGSHSYNLHNKTVGEIKQFFYDGASKEIVNDFVKNARYLESVTKTPVKTLSYPNGIWTSGADNALKDAGFIATFTSDELCITNITDPCGRYNRYDFKSAKTIIDHIE